jgi:hypothetical protein
MHMYVHMCMHMVGDPSPSSCHAAPLLPTGKRPAFVNVHHCCNMHLASVQKQAGAGHVCECSVGAERGLVG